MLVYKVVNTWPKNVNKVVNRLKNCRREFVNRFSSVTALLTKVLTGKSIENTGFFAVLSTLLQIFV